MLKLLFISIFVVLYCTYSIASELTPLSLDIENDSSFNKKYKLYSSRKAYRQKFRKYHNDPIKESFIKMTSPNNLTTTYINMNYGFNQAKINSAATGQMFIFGSSNENNANGLSTKYFSRFFSLSNRLSLYKCKKIEDKSEGGLRLQTHRIGFSWKL